jgi:hypothetical protein
MIVNSPHGRLFGVLHRDAAEQAGGSVEDDERRIDACAS